jgi:hypothetical protein
MNSNTESTRRLDFDQNGYIFCKSFLNTATVAEINDRLLGFIAAKIWTLPREHVFLEKVDDPNSLKQIQRLHEYDEFFGRLMNQGAPRKLAEELLGTEVRCVNMQYFNKPAGIGQPTPPHQDGYYFKLEPCEALTMWMALEPVDEENGCVRYVKGSHKKEMRHHDATGTLGFSQGIVDFPTDEDTANEIAFPAEPGDLLAHHALTIHRANGNQSKTRSRKALGFIYYSVNAVEDVEAHQRYAEELKKRLIESGKI